MNNDLISREALRKAFLNHSCTEFEIKNMCRTDEHVIALIDNAPAVELFCSYLSDGEVRQPCFEAPCEQEMSQAFINGIVELISKNGITTVDELLETLKGGA